MFKQKPMQKEKQSEPHEVKRSLLLQHFLSYNTLVFSRSSIPELIAPVGHDFLQRPQRMHSVLLALRTGSACILQTSEHVPQCVHLDSSTRYRNTDMGLNSEYTAPSGHIYLQKGRQMIMEIIITAASSMDFHAYNQPTALCSDLFIRTRGMPPSSVPAGHSSLQK